MQINRIQVVFESKQIIKHNHLHVLTVILWGAPALYDVLKQYR